MDSDGLPIVGSGIDFTKVGAIHQKRTLAFLNHFVSHTVRFLNRFSCVCEEKLETLAVRLQRLETTMNILEAKLASIPGLENVTVPSSSDTTATSTPSAESEKAEKTEQTAPTSQSTAAPEAAPPTPAAQEEPPAEEKPKMTVSQDPRYIKFFKLLQVGVPPQALKLKMEAEGLDPNMIDTPDAPAPGGSPIPKQDSDAEFSSDENQASSDDDDSSGFSD